ncbi:GNAT family N-acetyltransferase [Geminicoccus harenae]|uniref:GNAT family N-acetyltransferase n=2 Tax=Geminicoccus harenae TaxID=2498453 RepID=UPI001C979134|nr:GNAT family N-acetyltransferase [Geminicoccus harenae]
MLVRPCGRVPLPQSFAYGEALAGLGRRVARLVGLDGAVVAQAASRRIGAVPLVLVSRGPLSIPGQDAAAAAWDLARAVREQFGRGLLLWSPPRPPRPCRLPVVTGHATCWVDLARPPAVLRAALDGKWRNQLLRAEAQRLVVRERHHGPEPAWLAARHRQHRREVGFRALPLSFLERIAAHSPGCRDRLVLVAVAGGQPVAGIWLQIHHGSATYLIGYADRQGRRLDAMRLLLWRGMLALQERGVGWLDLGGIATDRAPGLTRFKLGMGGSVSVEAGTYFRPLLR